MKKLFSLVALAGMFALMSFSILRLDKAQTYDCDDIACIVASMYADNGDDEWYGYYDIAYEACEEWN